MFIRKRHVIVTATLWKVSKFLQVGILTRMVLVVVFRRPILFTDSDLWEVHWPRDLSYSMSPP